MNLIKNLRDITAIRFHEIKFSGNIFLLDANYQEDKDYGTHDIALINEAWINMYDEYFEKTDNRMLRRELKNKKKGLKLLMTINILSVVIKSLTLLRDNEGYVSESIKYDFLLKLSESLKKTTSRVKIVTSRSIDENIEALDRFKKSSETTYKINFQKDLNLTEVDIMTFYEIKSKIENILGKDTLSEEMNMLQWIAYEKESIRKSKLNQDGKQSDKRSRSNKRTR